MLDKESQIFLGKRVLEGEVAEMLSLTVERKRSTMISRKDRDVAQFG